MADTGRTITLGGKAYLVTEDMARALEDREKEWNEEKAKLTAPAPKPIVPPSGQGDDLDADKIFENPREVLDKYGQKLTERILASIEEKEQARRAETEAVRSRDQFWVDFATAHPDLKDDLSLAKTVLFDNQRQFEKFKDKNDDQSKKEFIDMLADLTRKEIQKYLVRQKADQPPNAQPDHPFVEGATLKFNNQPPPKEGEEKPSSLTDIIKARADARKKAGGLRR